MMNCPVGPYDSSYLTLTAIDSIKPYSCNNFINPTIQIQNYGIDTIHSFRTKTYFNNIPVDSIVWNQNLKTYEVKYLTFNYTALANGSYKMKIITDRINGKTNITKDSISYRFTVASVSQNIPLNENFEYPDFPYNNWTITKEKLIFPDWDWIDLVYAKAVYIPLYNIPFGYYNEIIIPRLDFSGVLSPLLKFDYAYARNPKKEYDEISVCYKANCSDTWHTIAFFAIDSLSTAPDTEEFFIPTVSQWKTYKLSLSTIPKNPEVFISIRGLSHEGSNFYIDNLHISDPSSEISEIYNSEEKLYIYPNPASSLLNIYFTPEVSSYAEISIYNLLGCLMKVQKFYMFKEVKNETSIDINNFPEGMYTIIIKYGNQSTKSKLIVNK